MEDFLSDTFQRILVDFSPPAHLRAVEDGGSNEKLWNQIADSGFLEALAPESSGGAGLDLAAVLPLILACGQHLTPVPFAETMLARSLFLSVGHAPPAGPIVLAVAAGTGGDVACHAVPLAAVSDFALVDRGETLDLLRIDEATVRETGVHASLAADLVWSRPRPVASIAAPQARLLEIGAALDAAKMAGAMERVLELSLTYANDRQQFGRSIGKFQAIQHQLSVLAEHVFSSLMAVRMAFAPGVLLPSAKLAAVAKLRTSEAVPHVAAIAHAVHGAIGISEEYDLQLFTRRLHEWRLANGSDSYWAHRLGEARLRAGEGTSVDFIRTELAG